MKLVPLIHLRPTRVAQYQVTFAVRDNKTGVQFGKSTTINVMIYVSTWMDNFVG